MRDMQARPCAIINPTYCATDCVDRDVVHKLEIECYIANAWVFIPEDGVEVFVLFEVDIEREQGVEQHFREHNIKDGQLHGPVLTEQIPVSGRSGMHGYDVPADKLAKRR